jgi:RNA polymerase sigma-70 factor (ECF subfamily)
LLTLEERPEDPPPSQPTADDALVAATLAGDLAAYDELMRRYERLVFKVAYGFTGTREGALDVTPAAFLKAYRGLSGFRRRSVFKTWLLGIVLNEGRDWQRRWRRRDGRHEPLDALGETATPGRDPEAAALLGEDRERLHRGLQSLNRRHRLAVVLRYFQGLPMRDIAAALGCSEVTARNILFRSLKRLRSALEVSA